MINSQNCGFPDEVALFQFDPSSSFNGGDPVQIKVKVLAMMNDDGSEGVDATTAELYMSEVADEFLEDYGIDIDYCIKEVRSDIFYNYNGVLYGGYDWSSFTLQLFDGCTTTACGRVLSSNGIPQMGWAKIGHDIIMHELGHAFGLPHTHNNENNRWPECLTNPLGPIDCAETINQRNCNNNGPLTCTIEGDGFCDTPADRYTSQNFDRCNVPHPTQIPQTLLSNYMSYHGQRHEFTNDQHTYMLNFITTYLSHYSGPWELTECLCSSDIILDYGVKVVYNISPGNASNLPIRGTSYTLIGSNNEFTFNSILYDFEEIVVGDGATIIFDNAIIEPDPLCKNSIFKGIKVKSGGHLIIKNSQIFNADYGIIAESGSTVDIDGLEVYGRSSTHGEGIRLNGAVNLIKAININIDKFRHGIFGWGGNSIYNIKTGTVTNSLYPIDMIEASVILDDYTIDNAFLGIRLTNAAGSMIINNKIGYTYTGIQTLWSPNVLIKNNEIGFNQHYGNTGIRLSLSHGSLVEDNPLIYGKNLGIDFWNSKGVVAGNNIDIIGSNNQYGGGISIKNSAGCQVIKNYIDADQSAFGIETIEGIGNGISNNHIVVYSDFSISDRIAGIKLEGSMDETIEENVIDGSRSASGIIVQNSSSSKSLCNLCNDTNEGLGIFYNSEDHQIKGNEFYSNVDLVIRSRVGVQEHNGNKFHGESVRANELSSEERQLSLFKVNQNIPILWPNNIQPNDESWFTHEDNLNQYQCDGTYGPGWIPFGGDPVKICAYWNYLKSIRLTKPELFFIKLYHLLKYSKIKSGFNLPNCIKLDPVFQTVCGLTKLIDASIVLDNIGKVNANTTLLTNLQEQYVQEPTETERSTIKNQIESELLTLVPLIETERRQDSVRLDSIETELNNISCTQVIVTKWREILKLYVKFLRQGEVEQNDKSAILNYSSACSDLYGDAIHLARAMANTFDNTYFDVNDGCLIISPPRSSKISKDEVEINIYPNPTLGKIYLELPLYYNGSLDVYNVNGKEILSFDIVNSNIQEIDLSDQPGVFYILLRSNEGSIISKKIIVLK